MAKNASVVGEDVYVSPVREKREQKQRSLFLFVALGVVYAIVVASLWIICRSPLLRLGEIKVEGNQTVPTRDVITLVQAAIKHGQAKPRYFLINNMLSYPKQLSSAELALVPEIVEMTLEKDYSSHTILAKVKERRPAGIFCRHEPPDLSTCYWFDNNGLIFQPSAIAEGSLIHVLHDYSNSDVGLNTRILEPEFVANIFSIFDVLTHSSIAFKEIRLNDRSLQEIEVTTYDGPKLLFSLRFPANAAAAALTALRTTSSFKKLEYIDFRVENRVYYK